jgi:hypothetical protein
MTGAGSWLFSMVASGVQVNLAVLDEVLTCIKGAVQKNQWHYLKVSRKEVNCAYGVAKECGVG